MNDIREIRAQIGHNPNAVLHVWPKYTPDALDERRDELLWGWLRACQEIVLRLGRFPLHFGAKVGPPEFEPPPTPTVLWTPNPQPAPPKMKSWGLTKLDAHTWAVTPSVHLPGAFHGYVVLCEVPEPAPWEVP